MRLVTRDKCTTEEEGGAPPLHGLDAPLCSLRNRSESTTQRGSNRVVHSVLLTCCAVAPPPSGGSPAGIIPERKLIIYSTELTTPNQKERTGRVESILRRRFARSGGLSKSNTTPILGA